MRLDRTSPVCRKPALAVGQREVHATAGQARLRKQPGSRDAVRAFNRDRHPVANGERECVVALAVQWTLFQGECPLVPLSREECCRRQTADLRRSRNVGQAAPCQHHRRCRHYPLRHLNTLSNALNGASITGGYRAAIPALRQGGAS